jgi:mono/diheme cytochrome c family protein
LLLAGCGGSDEQKAAAPTKSPSPAAAPNSPPAAPSTASAQSAAPVETAATSTPNAERGRIHYLTFCASCHGASGGGDGPLSETLDPKPARHNDGDYMNPLSDEHLFNVIKLGGASVGKSPLMAPWGGALTDPQIHDVVAFLRTLSAPQ